MRILRHLHLLKSINRRILFGLAANVAAIQLHDWNQAITGVETIPGKKNLLAVSNQSGVSRLCR